MEAYEAERHALAREMERKYGLPALVGEILRKGGDPAEHITFRRTGSARDNTKVGTFAEVVNDRGDVAKMFTMIKVNHLARTVWINEVEPGLWQGVLAGGSVPLQSGHSDRPFSVIQHLIEVDEVLSPGEMMFETQLAIKAFNASA